MHFLFWRAILRRPKFVLSRFNLRGKQGVRRYNTTYVRIPAELRGACSEHSKVAELALMSRGRVPPR